MTFLPPRRHLVLTIAIAAITLPATAVAVPRADPGPASIPPTNDVLATAAVAVTDDFPVTIEHAQGTVTITARPERVVTLGVADAQIASALGANIVGATVNPARDDGNWAGVEPPLGAAITVLSDSTPNLEQLAELEPDLILATTAYPTYGDVYDELSEIAPVISYKTTLLGDDGDELTRMIGAALGERALADTLIAESDALVAEFVEAHPGLAGTRYLLGQYFSGTLQLLAGADTPSAQFLARIGLVVPEEVAVFDDGSLPAGMANIAGEQFGLLDTAEVVFLRMYGQGAEEEFRANPLVAELRLETEGALHIISDDLITLLFAPNPAVTDDIIADFGPLLVELAGPAG